MKQYRPHIFVLVALAIVLASGWHSALRNDLTDLRFGWQSRQASGDIVVIAIDAPSIEKIGIWPWPRRLHADLLRRLESAGVQDVVFDVDFSSPSDAASDQAFVEALQGAGGSVVLPSFKQPGAARVRPCQSSASAISRSFLDSRRQCQRRAGWPGAALPVRRAA